MKTLIFLLISLSSHVLYAQLSTEQETARNNLLRDNSIKAQENLNKQNANKPQSTIGTLSDKPLGTDNTSNLTDQDKQLSENFVHQGKANRLIQEACAGDKAAICNGQEGKHKFLGMDPGMIKALTQAYAMFGAMGGDSFLPLSKGKSDAKTDGAAKTDAAKTDKAAEKAGDKTADKAGEKAGDKAGDKKDEKASDYCKYIPVATEGVATFTQKSTTSDLASQITNGETTQKDSFLKVAKSHDNRAKMAQIQSMGWFGGAACYGVSAATGTFAVDKNLIIKMGAAVLLGTFYQSEVSANKKYAADMRRLADSLPGKGDCNPITDKLCYCSQPETESDPQYCIKQLHTKKIAGDSYRVACTDNMMKIDPTCSCEARNECFDGFLEAKSQGVLGLGSGYVNSPFKSVRSLTRGELEGGTLSGKSFDRTSAIAKKALNELGSRFDKVPLNGAQKSVADALISKGIPANVASLMASNPPSASATDAALAKMSGSSGDMMAIASPGKSSNIVDFSGGDGLGVRGEVAKKKEDDLASKLKLGGDKKGNSKLLEFAARAEANAQKTGQIRREDDRPLFEIISERYQLSGRKMLQVEGE